MDPSRVVGNLETSESHHVTEKLGDDGKIVDPKGLIYISVTTSTSTVTSTSTISATNTATLCTSAIICQTTSTDGMAPSVNCGAATNVCQSLRP